MLPMFKNTEDAAISLNINVQLKGIDEIHIGLNDLHLDIGLKSHFELLHSQFL